MSATLLDLPSKTLETFVPCAGCPALQRLERELAELRREVSELRCDVGYWKSRHADAVQRTEHWSIQLSAISRQLRPNTARREGAQSPGRIAIEGFCWVVTRKTGRTCRERLLRRPRSGVGRPWRYAEGHRGRSLQALPGVTELAGQKPSGRLGEPTYESAA
jgi:hypothetical protein